MWGERRERAPGLRALGARPMLVPAPVATPGLGDAASMLLLRANRGAEAGAGAAEGQGADGSQEAVGHLGAGGERGV